MLSIWIDLKLSLLEVVRIILHLALSFENITFSAFHSAIRKCNLPKTAGRATQMSLNSVLL